MNVLDTAKRAQIIGCLIEGNSMRATCRMTGVAKKTVERLLVSVGNACAAYHDKAMMNLPCKLIQVDEVWSFVGAKEKNTTADKKAYGWGDTWTWISLDSESKLIPSWYVGERNYSSAYFFIHDLKKRLAHRIQLSSDGLKCYIAAVEDAFADEIDYSQLIKLYGAPPQHGKDNPTTVRYSPPPYIGSRKRRIIGNPKKELVSTSHIERQNLSLRMGNRRYTRLTNAFSKKLENHKHSLAIHFTHYNFARVHQSLRVTPAMEAGVSDHVWSLEEIVELVNYSDCATVVE